ncbi:MAG: hypothetical protein QW625_03200, partial [Candidatus Nanoarchaeia archaeon]
IAALVDEIGNDLVDEGKLKGWRLLKIIFSYRGFLEIVTFLVSLLLSEWIFFLSLLAFDLGYLSTKKILKKCNIK